MEPGPREALQTAWSAIRDAKVSAIPERHTPKVVHLYVLPQSIEAVCEDEEGKLIDRASRLLADSEQNYTKVEKTLLALVLAAVKFETFLDSSATVFTCESKETIKQIQQVHRARRVERLLLQVPPGIEVRMQQRHTTAMLCAEQPPDAILYTDGAAIANGKPTCRAGWGVYCLTEPELSCSGTVQDKPSNQTAELTAIIKACELARKMGWRKVCIVSDSKYALNAVENWLPRWLENGFRDCKNKPLANQDRIKELIEATQGLDIEWRFTEGHAGDFGNDKADELARNAITGTVTCTLVINFGKEQQLADPEIKKTYEEIAKQGGDPNDRYRKFRIVDELLNYVDVNGADPRLVVPKQQRHLLLRLAHDDERYGGHLGVRKTMKKLKSYWWYGMSTDVKAYVRSCNICQQFRNPKGKKVGKLCNIPVSRLFERLHLDIIGPMHSNTKKGNKYVMTGIDAYSRFAFAEAFPDSRTEFCMDFLQDIIALHGAPDYIVTDQGPQYMSVEWGDLMRKFHIIGQTPITRSPMGWMSA